LELKAAIQLNNLINEDEANQHMSGAQVRSEGAVEEILQRYCDKDKNRMMMER
jgi:hypothetical protein